MAEEQTSLITSDNKLLCPYCQSINIKWKSMLRYKCRACNKTLRTV